MKLKKLFSDKCYDILYLSAFAILFIGALYRAVCCIRVGEGAFINDCLFNFNAGFIRRGLGGEIIFAIQDYLGIPVAWTLYISSVLAYIFLGVVLVRLFRRKGYGLQVLIMFCVLGGALVYRFDALRRDYIELALLAVVLLLYRKQSTVSWLVTGNLLMMFAIALHEATFFFTVPILILITNLRTGNIYKSVCAWLPATLMFLACCVFRGSAEMLPPILERATEYAPQSTNNGKTAGLLIFIEIDTLQTFMMHLGYNFTSVNHDLPIPCPAWIMTFFALVYTPYMTIALIKAFTKRNIPATATSNLLKIILIQFISLLPMFTVLSCDLARVCAYWIVSSLLVWLTVGEKDQAAMFKSTYNRLVDRASAKIFQKRIPGKFALTAMAFCIGVPFYQRLYSELIFESLGFNVLYVIYRTLRLIYGLF